MGKKYFSILPVLISILVFTAFFKIAGHSAYNEQYIDLAGKWKIIESDTPANAAVKQGDSIFQDINIPGNWLDILKRNDDLTATVWIRKKIFIDSNQVMKLPVLFIERIAIADEAYFNGVRIGASGIIPPSPDDLHYQIAWHTPRKYFIPDNIIRYGEENVVAFRIYSHIQSGVTGEVALYDYYDGYFRQVLRSFKPLIITIAAFVLNLMLILVFLLLFISANKKTEYLYFTMVITSTLICLFLASPMPVMMDGVLRYKFFIFFYAMASFFVLHGVKKFLSFKSRLLTYISICFFFLIEAGLMLAPSSKFLAFYSGFASLIFVNLCILTSAVLFINAIRIDPRRYWYFLFLVIPVPISVMRNSYFIFSFRFNELPLVIFMHVPLVFVFITLYYIYDFEKSNKEKEMLYTALLKKSKKDSRLLNSIKNHNKKPEPRDLIANVIEYLDSNYSEKYDRIELSKKFSLNEDYMGQIFKKATGTNISNYINNNRIDAAKELIVETNAKIIDIAYHVGFDNLTHFHRQFKKKTGCTPNEFRVISRKGED